MALVATGGLMLVNGELRSAERDVGRQRAQLEMEGAAATAAFRLMHETGDPVLLWTEPSNRGDLRVTAEPEARKLAAAEVGFGDNPRLLRAAFGDRGQDIVGALTALSARERAVSKARLAGLDLGTDWRLCGATLVSPYSRLTAFAMAPPRALSPGPLGLRAGEVWRIQVSGGDGGWLDQVVRLTGDPAAPAAVIEQAAGVDRNRERDKCLDRIERAAGVLR
jgi:hypothetical protein